jgi:hypothetical protein
MGFFQSGIFPASRHASQRGEEPARGTFLTRRPTFVSCDKIQSCSRLVTLRSKCHTHPHRPAASLVDVPISMRGSPRDSHARPANLDRAMSGGLKAAPAPDDIAPSFERDQHAPQIPSAPDAPGPQIPSCSRRRCPPSPSSPPRCRCPSRSPRRSRSPSRCRCHRLRRACRTASPPFWLRTSVG